MSSLGKTSTDVHLAVGYVCLEPEEACDAAASVEAIGMTPGSGEKGGSDRNTRNSGIHVLHVE